MQSLFDEPSSVVGKTFESSPTGNLSHFEVLKEGSDFALRWVYMPLEKFLTLDY